MCVVLETLALVQKIMQFGFAVMIKATGQALSQPISKFLCNELGPLWTIKGLQGMVQRVPG